MPFVWKSARGYFLIWICCVKSDADKKTNGNNFQLHDFLWNSGNGNWISLLCEFIWIVCNKSQLNLQMWQIFFLFLFRHFPPKSIEYLCRKMSVFLSKEEMKKKSKIGCMNTSRSNLKIALNFWSTVIFGWRFSITCQFISLSYKKNVTSTSHKLSKKKYAQSCVHHRTHWNQFISLLITPQILLLIACGHPYFILYAFLLCSVFL